jgi:ribose 5-phosphate isomerase B
MKIALGADHAGFELKETIKAWLLEHGYTVDDRGTQSAASVDYPDYARAVGEEVAAGGADFGVLVCGTGMGMAMAVNKVSGIRAANVTTEFEAEMLRAHNAGNVLTLGARVVGAEQALRLVDKFLHTEFLGGRHQQRVDKIKAMEPLNHTVI